MTSRIDVTFDSNGERCAAWLYLPDDGSRAPVVVMAHGLGATREMRLAAFAERFCRAGYACLVFDYRHFGGSEGTPRQLLDVTKQLEDWKAAIAHVRARTDVDGRRLVLWGTSFSGGHVLAIAAEDADVQAVIAQCPFTDGIASSAVVPPALSLKLTALALRDLLRARLGRAPLMVPIVGKPGSTALMVAPDAEPGYLGLLPAEAAASFPNHVAARFALELLGYRPGRRTARIRCPALFCVCQHDSVAPSAPTIRYARRAPRGELSLHRRGHFEIYQGEAFDEVVADELAFLERTVPIVG